MAISIAYATHKGGVGKTTLAIQTAHIFAEKGLKTLLLDYDAQGNASSRVQKKPYEGTPVHALFQDELESIVPEQLAENLWGILQPINLETEDQLQEMVDVLDCPRHQILNPGKHLAKISDQFDVIIADTPPSLSSLLLGALMSVDNVVIPCEPAGFTRAAVSQIYDTINKAKQFVGHDLNVVGMVFNRVRYGIKHHDASMKEVRDSLKSLVFEAEVGVRSKLDLANFDKSPMSSYKDKTGKSTHNEVANVANEILERIEAQRAQKKGRLVG